MPLQLQYIAPASPTDTPAQVFAQRGPHDLYFGDAEDMARLQDLVKQLPTAAAGAAVAWPVLSQVTLPLVELAPDAEEQGYGAVRITTAAWTRFCSATMELAGPGATFESYGKMYETLSDKRRGAGDAMKDALTLRRTDLEPVQAEVAYDETVGDVAAQRKAAQMNEHQRARQWLNDMPLRTLRGADGMLSRVAMLACWLGSHISRDNREASHFCRSVITLRQAVGQKEKITESELDDDEVVDGVATLLATTPMEPLLMEWCAEPGGVKARSEMRKCINLWLSPGAEATTAHTAAALKEKLRTALRMLPAVHAMIGRTPGGQLPVDIGVAYQAVTTVAQRVGVCEQGKQLEPATLRELQSRISHLCDMLVVAPWSQRSFQERCDHVVIMLQTAQKRESAAGGAQAASGSQDADGKAAKGGAGAVPKHYQDKVPVAVASAAYITGKRAILQRLARGGAAADLDALQIATTGVVTGADGVAQPRAWIPLMVMMAEGGKLGVDANLVDPELARLAHIARVSWAELIGRAVALQLSVTRDQVHEHLRGFTLPDVVSATSGDDWSALDLGACYRAARTRLRMADDKNSSTDKQRQGEPYTTMEDVRDAYEVAEVVMTLRGFPGAGPGTLPHVLGQVLATWKIYAGPGCSKKLQRKLAEQGREYVTATLKRFGLVRHACLSSKNPAAELYDMTAPESAVRKFDLLKEGARLSDCLADESARERARSRREARQAQRADKRANKTKPETADAQETTAAALEEEASPSEERQLDDDGAEAPSTAKPSQGGKGKGGRARDGKRVNFGRQ